MLCAVLQAVNQSKHCYYEENIKVNGVEYFLQYLYSQDITKFIQLNDSLVKVMMGTSGLGRWFKPVWS